MKKIIIVLLGLCIGMVHAQQNGDNDTTDIESLDQLLISADRYQTTRNKSVQEIEVISSKKMYQLQGATLAETLVNTGKVFVQKSQMGGGSPVLRGFEASRVLIVVDGIRLNNSTFRAGHLQDIITVDQFGLDRMEVNFGSGSTLFGSDALGGVLYLKTREPQFSKELKLLTQANLRYQTASNSIIGNASLEIQSEKNAILFNVTHSKYGDLRMGSNSYVESNDSFGLQPYYVSNNSNNGLLFDTILKNDDPFLQPNSGYTQTDWMLKYKRNWKGIHTVNLQGSLNQGVPRFDRLQYLPPFPTGPTIDPRQAFRYGTWNYSPQNRWFGSYTYESQDIHQQRLRMAYQQFDVARVTRPFNMEIERTQKDRVGVYTLMYDRVDELLGFNLSSGLEYNFNKVESVGSQREITILNAPTELAKSRYADSTAKTASYAIYSHWNRGFGKTHLSFGGRLNYYTLDAKFRESNPWNLPFSDIQFHHLAPTFNVGIVQELFKGFLIKSSINQAFRNPNIDDMTKVFESIRGEKVFVPTTDLKPEVSLTYDLNFNWKVSEHVYVEFGGYYSKVNDLMSEVYGTIAGEDSMEWDGLLTPIYQIKNVGDGSIYGFFATIQWNVWKKLFLSASTTYTKGNVSYKTFSTQQEKVILPMDHIPPMYGQLSLKWKSDPYWLETQYLFNGEKKREDYSPSGEDNLNQSPGYYNLQLGNPAWGILNLRGGLRLFKGLSLQISAENLLDLRYRYFASGISASGRNISINLNYKF